MPTALVCIPQAKSHLGVSNSAKKWTEALGQAHEHRPVQGVHVLAGDLHGFAAVAGAQGCHEA